MTNIYTSMSVKHRKSSFTPEQDDELLRIEIAKDFSTHCTEALLLALHQMNKDIVHFITTDFVTKGLK